MGEDLASRKRKCPETGGEVAAGPGFEPGLSDSESLVLPLHHPARKATRRILTSISPSVEFPGNLLPPQKPLRLRGAIGDNYRRIEERRMILGDLLREYEPLADLYDLEYDQDYDLPFWLALAEREGGPVVEWGAGTGRLAAPLADVGLDVTAVETSQSMVQKGREKGGTVEWIRGDMRHVKLKERYGLAVCAFNSFLCLLSVNDALVFLRNAREHLKPDGLLGIEVSAFTPEELCEGAEGPVLHHDFTRERGQETPKRTLERFSVSRYDAASQLLRMRLFYELYGLRGELENKRAHELTIRIIGRGELELMLRLAGFEVEVVYGGFEGEPFIADSDHLIVLARRS